MFCSLKSVAAIVGASLMMLGAQANSHAQTAGSTYNAGGFLLNHQYMQVYTNATTDGVNTNGSLSVTTMQGHLWGFVNRMDIISANEVHVFAQEFYDNATLEVDFIKTGGHNVIAFKETSNVDGSVLACSGATADGSMKQLPLIGRITISPLTPVSIN